MTRWFRTQSFRLCHITSNNLLPVLAACPDYAQGSKAHGGGRPIDSSRELCPVTPGI
ncbi:MAG: hypothetical protein RBR99_01850 [Dehalococcoidales bacterium]|nr:hypothetical protein [Dehalococcoidales bacterium]